jgi:tetratricopeptide (TPR) repeat protein
MTANTGPGQSDTRVVEVPGGKGVYVGDFGTQVNVFGPQLEWPVLVGRAPLRADAFQERLELRRAVDEIRSGSTTSMATLVLAGDGGTGKTQLAAALFNSVRDGGADLAVWVSATSRVAVVDPYAQAYAATHPGAGGGDAERDALAFLAWLAATQRLWIVVLDDVADPGELSGLWPAGSAGRVVITTRRRDAALAARGRVVDVGVFSPQESLDYLTAKLGRAGALPSGALAQARELAADLGYLPLALAQAAAVIVNDAITCAAYRVLLTSRAHSLADLFPGDPDASGDEYGQTVAGTWSLAADRADGIDPVGLARPLLAVAAVLEPNGIPEAVLTGRATCGYLGPHRRRDGEATVSEAPVAAVDARRALRNLHRLSLVTHDPNDALRSVRIHALTQRWVSETLDRSALADVVRAAADAVLEAWPDVEGHSGLGEVLRANATTLAGRDPLAVWERAVHPIVFRAGRSLGEAGLVAEAVAHFQAAVDNSGRLLGCDHPDTLSARYELAYWRGEAGDFAGAAESQSELLADRLRILGADHPDTLGTRASLAYWQGHAGDPAGAAAATKAVIADMVRVLGPDHTTTLSARHNLADWQGRAGDPVGAAAAYEELLTDSLRVLGPDHFDSLDTRRNLAYWRGQTGDAAGAAAALEQVLADYSRVLGRDHPDTMHARDDLARWRGQAGDPAGAAAAYEGLLADRLRVLGPDHPHTLTTRHNLAEWRGLAGDAAAAAAAYEQLLADQMRILGLDHPYTMSTRHDLGGWRGEAHGAAAALRVLEPLTADRLRVLGPDHPDTLATRHNLAYWQARAADTGGAAAAFRELLQDQLRVFGPDHPDPLETRQELTELRGQSGDITGAITDLRQLLTDQQRVLGPGHPLTMITRAHLARWEELAALPDEH